MFQDYPRVLLPSTTLGYLLIVISWQVNCPNKIHQNSLLLSGEKLQEMLRVHGSMEVVNLQITRESIQQREDSLLGGWHTEASMALLPGWDECMPKCLSQS